MIEIIDPWLQGAGDTRKLTKRFTWCVTNRIKSSHPSCLHYTIWISWRSCWYPSVLFYVLVVWHVTSAQSKHRVISWKFYLYITCHWGLLGNFSHPSLSLSFLQWKMAMNRIDVNISTVKWETICKAWTWKSDWWLGHFLVLRPRAEIQLLSPQFLLS